MKTQYFRNNNCFACFISGSKKAFDTVNYDILLHKLELCGITCCALSLIQSCLSDRTQKYKLDDKISSERHVKCGNPQGSILGPLLFLVNINLSECLTQITSPLLADDTNLMVAVGEVGLAMNKDPCMYKGMAVCQ